MNNIVKILTALIIIAGLGYFFYFKSQDKDSVLQSIIKEKNPFESAAYTFMPRDELYLNKDSLSVAMITELKSRYEDQLIKLSKEVESTGAKFILCYFTTEVGDSEIPLQKLGKKFIREICAKNNIEFVDFTEIFINRSAKEITFQPLDGHLNKLGARLSADRVALIINDYTSQKSTALYNDAERPKLFADFEPGETTETGGKNLPYRLKVNVQGLRMDEDLTFPKKKQRVLLMGDSGFFFPFLDNQYTGTGLLQKMFPDKEILNSAKIGYTVEDHYSLWTERVKYAEPDLVLMQTSGDDIVDLFFSQRLKMSRKADDVRPTKTEVKYYEVFKPKS